MNQSNKKLEYIKDIGVNHFQDPSRNWLEDLSKE